MTPRVVVLGGGPAGLAAADALADWQPTLIEGADVGGLCASFYLGGTTFDLGGHALFSRDPMLLEWIRAESASELYRQPRAAFVASHGTVVPYPFQTNLHGLPLDVSAAGVVDFVTAQANMGADDQPDVSFDQWIPRVFGETIANEFLLPYNRKLWAFPLAEMDRRWTASRIVIPTADAVVRGAIREVDYRDYPNSTVRYPEGPGGYIGILAKLIARVEAFVVHERAVAINTHDKVVTTEVGHEFPYDVLINTIPIPELCRMLSPADSHLLGLASNLRHNSIALISLVFESRIPNELAQTFHRVYCADPDAYFHKLVINSNSNQVLRAGPLGVQAEISFSPTKPLPPQAELVQNTTAWSEKLDLAPANALVAQDVRILKYAYPIPTPGLSTTIHEMKRRLAAEEIWTAGRFAEWSYINADDALRRGREVAGSIRGKAPDEA